MVQITAEEYDKVLSPHHEDAISRVILDVQAVLSEM